MTIPITDLPLTGHVFLFRRRRGWSTHDGLPGFTYVCDKGLRKFFSDIPNDATAVALWWKPVEWLDPNTTTDTYYTARRTGDSLRCLDTGRLVDTGLLHHLPPDVLLAIGCCYVPRGGC